MPRAIEVALDHQSAAKLQQIADESGVSADQVAQAMIETFLEQTNNIDKELRKTNAATHFRAKKGPRN